MDENKKLRELLWLHHGCPISILYGDDGKMQCPKHMVDFATDPVEKIERHLTSQSSGREKVDSSWPDPMGDEGEW